MATTQRFPRFLTFGPGEREALLREKLGLPPEAPLPYEMTRRDGLVKATSFIVPFPDATEGTCRYERCGPTWHLFNFTYHDGATLPMQLCTQKLASYLPILEAKGKELAESAYARACNEECDRYFKRASLPQDGSRTRHPERSQMKAGRAKELSGRYALCLRGGKGLIAISANYLTLREANAAWKDTQDTKLIVACCNRLDRCWEIPKYNPLYAEFDPTTLGLVKGDFPWSSWR